jgi:hypothetical protein
MEMIMWSALVLLTYIIGGAIFLSCVKVHSMHIGVLLAWPLVLVMMLVRSFLDWRDGVS